METVVSALERNKSIEELKPSTGRVSVIIENVSTKIEVDREKAKFDLESENGDNIFLEKKITDESITTLENNLTKAEFEESLHKLIELSEIVGDGILSLRDVFSQVATIHFKLIGDQLHFEEMWDLFTLPNAAKESPEKHDIDTVLQINERLEKLILEEENEMKNVSCNL